MIAGLSKQGLGSRADSQFKGAMILTAMCTCFGGQKTNTGIILTLTIIDLLILMVIQYSEHRLQSCQSASACFDVPMSVVLSVGSELTASRVSIAPQGANQYRVICFLCLTPYVHVTGLSPRLGLA